MTVALSPLPAAQASDVGLLNAALREDTRRIIRSTPSIRAEGNSFINAAGAALWRENTVLSLWHEMTDGDDAKPLEEVRDYNPYAKLKSLFDADTLTQIAPEISRGDFDLVRSDSQLRGTVEDMLFEKRQAKAMEGNGLGYFTGSVLAALVDPISYVPIIGQGAKAGALGRGVLFGLNASLSAGVSEAVLQATQRDRSMTETLMNVGISGVLGGGLGVFAHASHPKSVLHPRNADNPLAKANLRSAGEVTVDARGIREELSAAEIKALDEDYVSSAAAAAGADVRFGVMPTIARRDPKTFVGKAARVAGDFVNSATIKGQVLRAASGPARWIGVRLFDPAGILMEHNLRGVANAKSATIVKQSYMSEYELLVSGMQAETRKLAQEIERKPDFKDVMLLTQRHLYAMLDEATSAPLAQKYGSDFDKVNALAEQFAETVHQHNEVWEKRLTDAGILQDPAEVARLEADVKAAREAVNSVDKDSPELAQLRVDRDHKVQLLSAEKAKGAPLGREYGHAQMWNREAVFQAPSEFKGWLHDVFAFRPDELWLVENHGMTLKEFDALTPEAARPIREDWSGDEYAWRIEQTELQLKGQQEKLKNAGLDLDEALRSLNLAERHETSITLSEARKRRDLFHAEAKAKKAPDLQARADQLNNRLREVESLHAAITRTRRELGDVVSEARKARKIEATSVSKVKRALKSARAKTPLDEMVDDVYDMLSRRGSVPHGIIQRLTAESDRTAGRVKERSLNLSRDQRVDAIQRGWLRDDLSNILHAQTDQLASELSIREALDIGKGKSFESWNDAMQWVERSYQDMIEEAADQKTKNALEAERKRTVLNLTEARDRLKGGNFVEDGTANGWIRWASSKVKQANLIRYGSGFLVSSLTDTATFALRRGSVSGNIARYGVRAAKIMAKASEEDPRHLEAFIRSVEIGMGAHAAAKRFGTEDALHGSLYGYGIGTGMTRKVTAKVDRAGEIMSEFGVQMGGLPVWNTFLKTVAGLSMLDELAERTMNYGKLSAAHVADLATLGIGRGEADQIARFMKQHGVTDEAGHFDPRLDEWDGEAGLEAARNVEIAIMRDMNRAVNTPDVGDTPRLMSTLHGSMLLTFQTFAFTFMNQYAYPLVQRLALFQDRQAMMSLGVLLGSATMVLVGKDILNGRDPAERFRQENMTKTLYEIVDRSGLMGFLSPYADSALKLTGIGGGERYARNGWAESMLGINYALFQDLQQTGATLFSDDPDKFRKLFNVVPYATQARLLGRFINQE